MSRGSSDAGRRRGPTPAPARRCSCWRCWEGWQARGKHMGRNPALTQQQQAKAPQRRVEGTSLPELVDNYNVGRATMSWYALDKIR